jgi:hypothetical protein
MLWLVLVVVPKVGAKWLKASERVQELEHDNDRIAAQLDKQLGTDRHTRTRANEGVHPPLSNV